jgi:hypothetical protein
MFQKLYELICGKNVDPAYATNIYPSVGFFTFIFVVIILIIFYIILGRLVHLWYTRLHWGITILFLAIVAFVYALYQAKGETQAESYDSFMIKFSIVNATYAAIFFILLSFLFKRFSKYSKRTPF